MATREEIKAAQQQANLMTRVAEKQQSSGSHKQAADAQRAVVALIATGTDHPLAQQISDAASARADHHDKKAIKARKDSKMQTTRKDAESRKSPAMVASSSALAASDRANKSGDMGHHEAASDFHTKAANLHDQEGDKRRAADHREMSAQHQEKQLNRYHNRGDSADLHARTDAFLERAKGLVRKDASMGSSFADPHYKPGEAAAMLSSRASKASGSAKTAEDHENAASMHKTAANAHRSLGNTTEQKVHEKMRDSHLAEAARASGGERGDSLHERVDAFLDKHGYVKTDAVVAGVRVGEDRPALPPKSPGLYDQPQGCQFGPLKYTVHNVTENYGSRVHSSHTTEAAARAAADATARKGQATKVFVNEGDGEHKLLDHYPASLKKGRK